MPTKTWEPPPIQPDTDVRPQPQGSDEPGKFETASRARALNPDASAPRERGSVDYDEINLHGSER